MIRPGGVTERLPTSGNRFDNSNEEAREAGDVVRKHRFGPVHTVDSLAHVVPLRVALAVVPGMAKADLFREVGSTPLRVGAVRFL